ncbi:hypothetical protein PGT21_011606 [Puccinia graminis f. sp. tritici]|uniref:Uncharacterized protein n=1 Tax=Puccinia graminis f. sp. tritici TaxID=56615 RepID=A0A5B0LL89_PUCGR|nr:hypothetical protein PGT21_011606 [Puccinia graminis f. sp. tritici]
MKSQICIKIAMIWVDTKKKVFATTSVMGPRPHKAHTLIRGQSLTSLQAGILMALQYVRLPSTHYSPIITPKCGHTMARIPPNLADIFRLLLYRYYFPSEFRRSYGRRYLPPSGFTTFRFKEAVACGVDTLQAELTDKIKFGRLLQDPYTLQYHPPASVSYPLFSVSDELQIVINFIQAVAVGFLSKDFKRGC